MPAHACGQTLVDKQVLGQQQEGRRGLRVFPLRDFNGIKW
jgi:hypothetical protein